MSAKVSTVVEKSIADEMEIQAGDEVLTIDNQPIVDMIDYNFYCKSEFLTLQIKKTDGEIEFMEIEKEYDENLGIVFESAVFDKIKPCLNKCIFCFVDQQPKGLRDTLYIKDDDYRLSYLQGTYITLTNLTDADKKRIETLHLGPFYVSVHTTNPELRVKMLRNPNAGKIMENLKWLKKHDIPFHAQIVLCPKYNDNDELKRTLDDLAKLKALSVAIVPVGVTNFRKDSLKTVDKKIALKTIEIAAKYKNVCCSDEFFLKAELEIPPSSYYGNFAQLEDGVGAIRLLLDDFERIELPKLIKLPLEILFATSNAAKPAIEHISNKLNTIGNLKSTVRAVNSKYWGQDITVAGLITSDDLINEIKTTNANLVIIPSIMLKPYSEDFLDGKNLDYVRAQTGKEFFIVKNCYSAGEIVDELKKRA